jgi:hypothetical protein
MNLIGQIKNRRAKRQTPDDSVRASVGTPVPIHFAPDLPLCFPIKTQPLNPMNKPEKPLVPALFQIAARIHEPESALALKSLMRRGALADAMLNAQKLESVLKTIARKKKNGLRRVSSHQRLSLDADDRQTA